MSMWRLFQRKAKGGPNQDIMNPENIRVKPEDNLAQSHFLQLPGEIRNMIYYYITYPTLKTATIASGRSERAFGVTLLNLTVFRVSHQVRTEALSFLVSNKQLLILGIDVAAAFFSCIGDGIRYVKRVIIHQPLIIRQPILEEDMDKFFKLLRRATSLVQLKLELGNLPLGGDAVSWV